MKIVIVLFFASITLMADIFSQGSASLGIKLGSASISRENYTIAGISGNYFVLDDLSVGLGYEKWFSGNPNVQKITLESTYFIPADEKIHPYAGLLYRRISIGNEMEDINAYGYRAGLAIVNANLLMSIGMVQERYETKSGIFDGSDTYAEIIIGFFF